MEIDIKLEKEGQDSKICNLDSGSTIDQIRQGLSYAGDKFQQNYDYLKEIDVQYRAETDPKRAQELDKDFYRVASIVGYYNKEYDRIIKIWGKKTGGFYFTAGKNGLQINHPGGESVAVGQDDIGTIQNMLEPVFKRTKFKVIQS